MGESDVRQLADRPGHLGRPAFDLIAAKLLRPLLRPATIRRSSLVERLAREFGCAVLLPVASIAFPWALLIGRFRRRWLG